MARTDGTFAANLKPTLRAVSITLALLFTLIATTPTTAQTGSPSGDRDAPPPAPTVAQTGSPSSDRDALVAFFNATDGPNWTNNTNWLTDEPVDEWHGVETYPNGRVFRIDLIDNRLMGHLPAELGNLSNLGKLGLWSNKLSGRIPPEIGGLTNLLEVGLGENELTGEIPTELARLSNLTVLDLGNNQLSGHIPTELASLSKLTELDLWWKPAWRTDTTRIGRDGRPEVPGRGLQRVDRRRTRRHRQAVRARVAQTLQKPAERDAPPKPDAVVPAAGPPLRSQRRPLRASR